ncbi:MAG TPA: hypothetical protein VN408_40305, partial [Actinoplanes sp.]|nr:hypothetical protein [Actinoplanes sp.]
MRRTYRRPGSGISGRNKKIMIGLVTAAVVGGGLAVGTGLSSASTSTFCDGQAQAIRNNENFIAQQRANPNAQTEAVIANRQAVIKQINLQMKAGGCDVADVPVAQPTTAAPTTPPAQATTPPANNGGGNNAG